MGSGRTAATGRRSDRMRSFANRFRRDRSGATSIEYALIAALVAMVIVTALTAVGASLSSTFQSVAGLFAG